MFKKVLREKLSIGLIAMRHASPKKCSLFHMSDSIWADEKAKAGIIARESETAYLPERASSPSRVLSLRLSSAVLEQNHPEWEDGDRGALRSRSSPRR